MKMVRDRIKNLKKGIGLVEEAAAEGAQIICLPELFTSLYFPHDRGAKPEPEPIPGPTTEALSEVAKRLKVILVGGSICEAEGGSLYNTSVVFDQSGKIVSKYRKVHVPQDEHYYEQDYFRSGNNYSIANTSLGKVGTLICFDQWYPEPARINKLVGAEILFYPTAIGWVEGIEPTEGDWKKAWESVQVGHAISNSIVVCAVNRVGVEGKTKFWGGSFVCDQFGKVLLRAGDKEGAYVATCDLGLRREVEDGWRFLRNRKPRTYGPIAE